MIEYVLNQRQNAILDKSQTDLQEGFTAGHSSIEAALILSDAKNSKKSLIVAMLEAQKAFDVLDHDLLLLWWNPWR